MTYHHIIFNASPSHTEKFSLQQDENYRDLFGRYRPSKVLILTTKTLSEIHPGLKSEVENRNLTPEICEIEDLTPPPNWTKEMLSTKPYRILSDMIDAFSQSNLERHKTLVTIVGGSALYSSLLLVLSRVIGASVVLNEGNREEPDYQIQSWLSRVEEYTQIKKHEKTFLANLLESKKTADYSIVGHDSQWKSAKEISGVNTKAPKAKGVSNTTSDLVENGLIESNNGDPVQYRLTAKGWTTALSTIELNSFASDKLSKIRASRITGLRLNRRPEEKVPAIRIATSLPFVEDWLTILGIERNQEIGGVTLFDHQSPSNVLSEEQIEIHNEWRDFLSSMEMNEHSWGLLDVVGDLEETFCNFCEWIWPRITGENPQRYWSLDLTQFTNKQIPIISHFAFSVGIPITWTSAPKGHVGVKTGVVKHNIENRSNRIFSVPNLDFSKYLIDGGKTVLEERIQILLALLYQEEQYKQDNENNLRKLNPFKEQTATKKGVKGGNIEQLAEIVAGISNQSIRAKLTFTPNSASHRASKKLVGEHFVEIKTVSQKHHLTLTPQGRLVARIIRDRMLSTMERSG
ncbi:MAG: hypothetical protein VYA86_03180 [Candidatus Thermoplasmatota archaeon]|nr:hypothetical protein [Candidatus Thermoplasmatota archaeon]